MVIDWKKHIINCYNSKKLIPIFHASSIEQRLQQTLLVKYLLEEKKHTFLTLQKWMKKLKNYEYSKGAVAELVLLAHKVSWPREKDFRVWITRSEIDYINSLGYDKEFASFLLAVVYVAKVMKIKKGCAAFNTRDRSYAYYLAHGVDDYNVGRQRRKHINKLLREIIHNKEISFSVAISKFRKKNSTKYTRSVTNVVLNAKWIDWDAKEGILVTVPEVEIQKICKKYISNKKIKCSNCGKMFIPSPKQKTDLCPTCYKAYRKNIINSNAKRYYKKKSETTSE